jgi:predicted nuclease of predicted toxin-antitoxin system
MRFLADENISHVVIERLRAGGFEVISIREVSPGAPDEDVLSTAHAKDCILITEDHDFGELVIRQRLGVRGMILLELDRLSSAIKADAVMDVISKHVDTLIGNLIVLEPGRIRRRPLPR